MTRFPKGALSFHFLSSFSSASFRERRILSLSLSLQTALFFSLSREILNFFDLIMMNVEKTLFPTTLLEKRRREKKR